MAVVGFDVGSFSSYIGVARAGGIETIANEYSDRCTPSYISLNERSRSVGAASKQQAVTNFKNTVIGFKRALGRSYKDPFIQKEKERFFRPNVLEEDKDGKVAFKMTYMGEQQTFSAAQLQTMLTSKLKQTAEIALKTKVVDAVVSCPVYFTDTERRALLDSCAGAGLNCLRLINDTTAAALGYGITKQDLPAESEKPRIVVFVDLGYSSLQVSACAFNKGKLKVLATSCDQQVGGRDFDEVLAKHFSAEFRSKYKVDPESKPKPYIRLLQECERLKKLMSANTQKIPLNIECFMDDKDVTSKMSREDFEEMSEHLLKRIDTCLSDLLTNAKLKPADIHSVEILGGASRIPAFKRIVTQVLSKEPSTTLNADEAVARGCALQCAILSPTFRVRDFSISDCQSYPITLSWVPQNQMDEDSRVEVLPQFHSMPSSKMLTFYRKEPFTLTAVYSTPANVPFPNPEIGSFKVNNVVPEANGESSKVKVKVRINGNGVFSVAGATLYEKVEGEEEKEEQMDVDEGQEKKDAASPVSNGTPDEAPMQTEQSGDTPAETSAETSADADSAAPTEGEKQAKKGEVTLTKGLSSPDTENALAQPSPAKRRKEAEDILTELQNMANYCSDNDNGTTEDILTELQNMANYYSDNDNGTSNLTGPEEGEKKGKKKNKVKTIELPIEGFTTQLSKEALNILTEKEGQMVAQDRLEKERADAKNTVEEYVYEMRDKISNEYEKFMKEEGRSTFREKLEATENWLYEEGEDQNKQVYLDRMADLKKIGQPVQDRYREAEEWPSARDQFGASLMHVRKFLDQCAAGEEKYAHLDKADVDKVQKCVEDKMAWWGPKMEAQSRIKPHDDPVLLVSQVLSEKQILESTCSPIMNKPKPKVEPPKEEKKAEETSTNNSGSGDPEPTPADPSTTSPPEPKGGEMDVD